MKKTIVAFVCLLCLSSLKGFASEPTRPLSQPTPADYQLTDFTDVAEKTINAVVHIKCSITKLTPYYQSFFGMIIDRGVQKQQYQAFGSGVIVSHDGYIITNNHVVADADDITVTLNDKRRLPAKLVGRDPATDLAVIKVDAKNLESIPFGNSDEAKIGEPVLAIGNPFNLTSTVTSGIISAKARNMNIISNPTGTESPIESFIQTDAAVNSGNSGGALVNAKAELIGVVTAIASGNGFYTGYSFAIPSNIAFKIFNDLRQYGCVQRGYLGVNVAEMDSELARKKGLNELNGVYVGRIIPDCAAFKAGLKEGDIILAVNNKPINSYSEMMEEVGLFSPGDVVTVTYLRDEKRCNAKLTLLNSQGNTEVIKSNLTK